MSLLVDMESKLVTLPVSVLLQETFHLHCTFTCHP